MPRASLVREAEVQGRRIMITVWMEKKFEAVGELLARIEPFYFDD